MTPGRHTTRVILVSLLLALPLSGAGAHAAAARSESARARPRDSDTQLPLSAFYEMQVDPIHGHVFVTGGAGTSSIVVLDFQGNIVTTIDGESSASGMTMSPDGRTLYVALIGGTLIDEIDTTTLSRTGSLPLGPLTATGALETAAGLLWFGYGVCGENQGVGIGSVNPSTGRVKKYIGQSYPFYCPRLTTSPTDPDLLMGWVGGLQPPEYWKYDASTTPPDLLLHGFLDDLTYNNDAAISPDGSKFLPAAWGVAAILEYNLADMTRDFTDYATAGGPIAIDVTPIKGGYLAAGAVAYVGADVYVFPFGVTTATFTYDFPYPAPALAGNGLAFAPDGTALFAVSEDGNYQGIEVFHVIDAPLAASSTLSISSSPEPAHLGDQVTVDGSLSFADGSDPSDWSIHVLRANPDGSVTTFPDLVTDSSGAFSFLDSPPSGGAFVYTAAYDGDPFHSPASATVTQHVTNPTAAADFNGDGYEDLAVGVPGEDTGYAVTDAGAVSVIYGSANGLSSVDNQWLDTTTAGCGLDALSDTFGWSTAAGDFNGDGFSDLAVGVPYREVDPRIDAGAVCVLNGGPKGLTATGSHLWDQNQLGIDTADGHDVFGYAVATGDLNGDGFDELVVGVPGESLGSVSDAGAVQVVYGSVTGLSVAGSQFWNQDSPSINDASEADDVFGFSVATGDFDADGFADLLTGIPGENNGAITDGGAASVIYGSAAGLTSDGDQFWTQNSTDIKDLSEAGDVFGFAVTTGDFDGDGFADMGSGVPFENNGSITDGGGVNVIYGTTSGLAATGNQWWNQNSTDINDSAEAYDSFGYSIAAGDFDGDGFDDFVSGTAGENNGVILDGGAANVIYGTPAGLNATGDQFWTQNSSGIEDSSEEGDLLGYTVTAGDFGNGPEDDLVLAATFESLGSVTAAGAVNVVYGTPTGLNSANDQFWNQDSTDILDTAEAYDEFGFGLSFGPGTAPGRLPIPLLGRG